MVLEGHVFHSFIQSKQLLLNILSFHLLLHEFYQHVFFLLFARLRLMKKNYKENRADFINT